MKFLYFTLFYLCACTFPLHADENLHAGENYDGFFALFLNHSIIEKRKLLSRIEDEKAREIISCSIFHETKLLIDYIELDLSSKFKKYETPDLYIKMSNGYKKFLEKENFEKRFNC